MSLDDRVTIVEREVAVLTERFDAVEKRAEERHTEQCQRLGAITASLDARDALDEKRRMEAEKYRLRREEREAKERDETRKWLRSLILTILTAALGGGTIVSWTMPRAPDAREIAEEVRAELTD